MMIREARPSDMSAIMQVMEAAKKIMRSSGNMYQWGEGYPSEAVILSDMEKNGGFVVEEDSKVVAYFAFLPSPEPTYDHIYGGRWLDDVQPYHVIHRIASTPESHGVLDALLDYCESIAQNIRIDTHEANVIMRKGLEKHGYRYCGIIHLLNGDERMAFQKNFLKDE